MSSSTVSRRRFLSQSAGLAAAAAFGPNLLLRGRDVASKRLNIAVIGALGKGEVDTGKVALDHNIVALVDIDSDRLGKATQSWEKKLAAAGQTAPQAPKGYADFRKMFDEMANSIDAVIVSTPDHTHYVAAMWALKHGKPIAVQKPLCNTIWGNPRPAPRGQGSRRAHADGQPGPHDGGASGLPRNGSIKGPSAR